MQGWIPSNPVKNFSDKGQRGVIFILYYGKVIVRYKTAKSVGWTTQPDTGFALLEKPVSQSRHVNRTFVQFQRTSEAPVQSFYSNTPLFTCLELPLLFDLHTAACLCLE